ncbi:MAG: septum formation initiator family protein [Acidimicrobiales bacterium]|jgi:cell division protein FtsL
MPKPRKTTIALVLATIVAVGYVMFVPARNYLNQQAATDDAEHQLDALDAELEDLNARQVALQDPEQIEQVARERFNLGYPGEEVFAVLPAPPAPLPIPTGWPFDVLRGAAAAAASGTAG